MRLQEVLKEREAEITALEGTLRERERASVNGNGKANGHPVNGDASHPQVNGHKNGLVTPPEDAAALMHLSPKTRSQFQELRRSLDFSLQPPTIGNDEAEVPDRGDSLDRLNELMRSEANALYSVKLYLTFCILGQWPRRSLRTKKRLIRLPTS